MKKLLLILIGFFVATALSEKSAADTSFDIDMLYKLMGLSDQAVLVTPEWLITNTSSQPLIIGDAGLIPFATMDFGSLPIQSPEFIFHPELISGYTLYFGESIGWSHIPLAFEPPLPPPTYDLTRGALFEFVGDYFPGSGTGHLKFGFGSAYVNVPITFGVGTQPLGYITGTFSSIPEPATIALLGLGAFVLRKRA